MNSIDELFQNVPPSQIPIQKPQKIDNIQKNTTQHFNSIWNSQPITLFQNYTLGINASLYNDTKNLNISKFIPNLIATLKEIIKYQYQSNNSSTSHLNDQLNALESITNIITNTISNDLQNIPNLHLNFIAALSGLIASYIDTIIFNNLQSNINQQNNMNKITDNIYENE